MTRWAEQVIRPTVQTTSRINGRKLPSRAAAGNIAYYMNESGHMDNPTLLDYRMPVSLDLPMIDTVIVEVPNPGHPYGVRGVGEVNIVPPPAAIANAVHRAVGVRMTRLPMKPETVLEEVWANGG